LSLGRYGRHPEPEFLAAKFQLLTCTQVYWSESGELVTLACEDTFYVLRFSRENYVEALQAGLAEEDGVESAFEVITDISERYGALLHLPTGAQRD
jgi:hypothetical protein